MDDATSLPTCSPSAGGGETVLSCAPQLGGSRRYASVPRPPSRCGHNALSRLGDATKHLYEVGGLLIPESGRRASTSARGQLGTEDSPAACAESRFSLTQRRAKRHGRTYSQAYSRRGMWSW